VELFKHIRKLQPGIIINDRADMHDYAGGWDFRSPEQAKLTEWPTENGIKMNWETCQTFSGSWGYHREEDTWKDTKQLIAMLISTVSMGGNLLLNVGPTGRGTFDFRAENALDQMGDWMKFNSRSIYGCTQAPPDRFEVPDNSLLTYNPTTNRLYIHLLDYPLKFLRLEGMKGKITHAQFLHDASELRVEDPKGHWASSEEGDVNLVIPVKTPPVEIPVIEINLK
jgi:alpha-L-fucosidase